MATRIELPKDFVAPAFDTKIASLKRAINTASNQGVKLALQDELAKIQAALNTMTEIK